MVFTLGSCDEFSEDTIAETKELFHALMGPAEIQGIKPILLGGTETKIHLVTSSDKAYVIRVMAGMGKRGVFNEITLSQNAAKLGISPQTHAVSFEKRTIVMDFIPSDSFLGDKTDPSIASLANKLRILHDKGDKTIKRSRLPSELLQEAIDEAGPNIPVEYQKAIDVIRTQISVLENEVDFTLIHGDLHPWNMLFNGNEVFFIDWADARTSHPFMDIATILIIYGFEEQQKITFLERYLGERLTKETQKKINIAYRLKCLMTSLSYYKNALKLGRDPSVAIDDFHLKKAKQVFENRDWQTVKTNVGNSDLILALSRLFLGEASP